MNGVFIIPTGIGCSIGGHAGDAVCAVNLVASVCDNLIVNPNAVNASDINEMAPNCLYTEGSIIDRFLEGEIGLKKVRQNKILLAVNSPLHINTINSVNAAKVALGIDIEICILESKLIMKAKHNKDGTAGGDVFCAENAINQIREHQFDALAIQTAIDVPDDVAEHYLKHGGVNPWGGVEAIASKIFATNLNKPVAHSPLEQENSYFSKFLEVVDPRMSAECVSVSYLHCILKGLAKAPRPEFCPKSGLDNQDIDFLISPDNCWGKPHSAALKGNIPIIAVRENSTVLLEFDMKAHISCINYLEAIGTIQSMKIGIKPERVLNQG